MRGRRAGGGEGSWECGMGRRRIHSARPHTKPHEKRHSPRLHGDDRRRALMVPESHSGRAPPPLPQAASAHSLRPLQRRQQTPAGPGSHSGHVLRPGEGTLWTTWAAEGGRGREGGWEGGWEIAVVHGREIAVNIQRQRASVRAQVISGNQPRVALQVHPCPPPIMPHSTLYSYLMSSSTG